MNAFERSQKQLKVARKALRAIPKIDLENDGYGEILNVVSNALAEMKQIARQPMGAMGPADYGPRKAGN